MKYCYTIKFNKKETKEIVRKLFRTIKNKNKDTYAVIIKKALTVYDKAIKNAK